MTPYVHRSIGSVIGIGILGGALVWGGQSLTMSHASGNGAPRYRGEPLHAAASAAR
mgnify:CR=1 FL=1